jgi:hypothetical protein
MHTTIEVMTPEVIESQDYEGRCVIGTLNIYLPATYSVSGVSVVSFGVTLATHGVNGLSPTWVYILFCMVMNFGFIIRRRKMYRIERLGSYFLCYIGFWTIMMSWGDPGFLAVLATMNGFLTGVLMVMQSMILSSKTYSLRQE